MNAHVRLACVLLLAVTCGPLLAAAAPPVLEKRKLLERETFWDNRDRDWYEANIPFFDSPDAELNTTYYYRWELFTKHLTYGSPESGYTFSEFIDRPFWSGKYGAISCPAGHQLYEARWLRDARISRDFARYWFRTPGAEPRRYSTWLADAIWAAQQVHPDRSFLVDILPDLVKNYESWEREHWVAEREMFVQTGHDDGMEININSRQTADKVRGAPGFRPTLNAYMYADALAISRVAELAGNKPLAAEYGGKAEKLKANLEKLWDERRGFYFPMASRDETADGHTVKAGTLTYQSGKFAGSDHGRELIGYVPWQFNMAPAGREAAWKFLMDPNYFAAKYGPTTTERHDPLFQVTDHCCVWSGQSWPFATTQTLVALANVLNNYKQQHVTKNDYYKLLRTFALTHRKDGQPYIAEGANPDTGSWKGYDNPGHSNHYFHSGFTDLVITGLCGLRPRDDNTVEVNPLVPDDWDYFALDDVPYRNHRLAIVWDKSGTRYKLGAGLHVLVDGEKLVSSPKLEKLTARLPASAAPPEEKPAFNFAVNNDGRYYPAVNASFSNAKTPVGNLQDGNYYYHQMPANRWTCDGTTNKSDSCVVAFGVPRKIHTVKLYLLDDGERILAPSAFALEYWNGTAWTEIPNQTRRPEKPAGHRANVIEFPPLETTQIRATFTHAVGGATGLTEFEVWGEGTLPLPQPPSTAGNLAANPKGQGFPQASASYTSRWDKVEKAIDTIINLRPDPNNRWTSWESKTDTDWLMIDFGKEQTLSRVVLYIYDDGGGVQAPASYQVQTWDGRDWREVAGAKRSPEKPAGGTHNTIIFTPVKTKKFRVIFTHAGAAKSGVSEIEAWKE